MKRIHHTKSKVYTFEKTKILSPIFYLIAYALALALQVAFLLFQISNKIITLWNIFPTALMAGIFVFVMKSVIAEHKAHNKKNNKSNEYSYNDEYDNKPKRPSYTDNANVISNKRTVKFILIQIFIMIAAFALSYLFYTIHDNKVKDLTLIDSVVVSQWGETTVKTESNNRGETTSTQTSYIEVTVEYEFNGEKKEAIITGSTTDKIYVEDLKIYIDAEGEFVSDYGRILIWQIESIILFAFGVFLLLILIFNLGTETFASAIFMVISFAVLSLFTCQFVENFLYNDISCFVSTFANISIYMMLMNIFNILFGKKIDKDEKSNSNLNYAGAGAVQSQNGEPQELTYNDFLEDPNRPNQSSYYSYDANNSNDNQDGQDTQDSQYNQNGQDYQDSQNYQNSDDNYSDDYSENNYSEESQDSNSDNYENNQESGNENGNDSSLSVCPNCSSPVSAGDKFCQECGTRL